MVALNRHTGKVIWNKQIADYQAGYSATAAPMVVKGKVIYGNSGGEFGFVGAVEARDVNTGELVWRRPTIEGHRSEEHTSELQSLMRISYAVFCLKQKKQQHKITDRRHNAPTSTKTHLIRSTNKH